MNKTQYTDTLDIILSKKIPWRYRFIWTNIDLVISSQISYLIIWMEDRFITKNIFSSKNNLPNNDLINDFLKLNGIDGATEIKKC